jgi:hypothetical protein
MAGRVLRIAASLVALGAMATTHPAGARSDYRDRGETVEVVGTVTNLSGAPVPDMQVVLLATHTGFNLRSMRRAEEGLVRLKTKTDAQGRFRLDWSWHPYYDTFRIRTEVAGSAAGSGLPPGVLTEVDISRRMLDASPVVVALEVDWAGAPGSAASQSDDQRRVYEEMGNPDRVDRLELPGGDEVAWWYFERGRSYHFRDGGLDQVMEFEPVKGN